MKLVLFELLKSVLAKCLKSTAVPVESKCPTEPIMKSPTFAVEFFRPFRPK